MSCRVASGSRAKLLRQAIGSRHPPLGVASGAERLLLILDGNSLLPRRTEEAICVGKLTRKGTWGTIANAPTAQATPCDAVGFERTVPQVHPHGAAGQAQWPGCGRSSSRASCGPLRRRCSPVPLQCKALRRRLCKLGNSARRSNKT